MIGLFYLNQSGPKSNGNEGVLHIPQHSRIVMILQIYVVYTKDIVILSEIK